MEMKRSEEIEVRKHASFNLTVKDYITLKTFLLDFYKGVDWRAIFAIIFPW